MPNVRGGHVNWTNWNFDWLVHDEEGLSLLNMRFRNTFILYKGSLPVIRVKYKKNAPKHALFLGPFLSAVGVGGCGPYADLIQWSYGGLFGLLGHYKLLHISNCNNELVCIREFVSGGMRWLHLGVLAQIGQYQIYQTWDLSENGAMNPRVWSRGLACKMDHIHHPYWRLDFDIETAAHGRVYLRTNYGWAYYLREGNDIKDPANNKVWYVANNQTGRGVWVTPGPHDGRADGFSRLDVGIRVYHPWEDKNPWNSKSGWLELPFANNEDVSDADVVFWYVSHLFHQHHHGGSSWHETGPDMQVQL